MKKKSVFELHPSLNAYFETSDGAKFFNVHDAKAHARNLKDKEVKEVKRPVEKEKKAPSAIEEAKKRAKAIKEMNSIEAIKKALENETAASVKKAGMERIQELEEALANAGEGNPDEGKNDNN